MKNLVLFFIWVASCPVLAQNSPASPLVDKTQAVMQAWKGKDVASLNQVLAHDFVAVGSEGKLHDRSELIDSAREGELQDFHAYNFRLIPINDSAVVVTFDCVIKMPEGDAPNMAPRYQRLSDLWVNEGGAWKLKFRQATAARPVD